MTFTEFHAARQLLAEEMVGAPLRAYQRQEDDAARASVKAIRDTQGI